MPARPVGWRRRLPRPASRSRCGRRPGSSIGTPTAAAPSCASTAAAAPWSWRDTSAGRMMTTSATYRRRHGARTAGQVPAGRGSPCRRRCSESPANSYSTWTARSTQAMCCASAVRTSSLNGRAVQAISTTHPVLTLGKALRHHPGVGDAGTNVHFVQYSPRRDPTSAASNAASRARPWPAAPVAWRRPSSVSRRGGYPVWAPISTGRSRRTPAAASDSASGRDASGRLTLEGDARRVAVMEVLEGASL